MNLATSVHLSSSLSHALPPSLSLTLLSSPFQAYFILDELLVGGEIQETSKKNIIRAVTAQDMLQEVSVAKVVRKKELLHS